ncbi:LysR family transcriptional regulator [Shewanella sp. UCD-KL21]|uniref:LysR family transcriptional regulator n=1 Tax=Shewanella sp. UCD-KL21 TaxID=1917164 RepID=UPI000970FAEA|nr:LysR family transcriptional regulator [Shewanella sp. UCD-KL21]
MNINIKNLLFALKIKELGTLTLAANAIHLTQSALTQGINKLESELGYSLFVRTPSGMQTTPVGLCFLSRVERAFRYLDEFAVTALTKDKARQWQFSRSITTKQLLGLVALVQQNSYTRAASVLGLSQPTLHKTIKDAEQICHDKLVMRSPAGIEATWLGKQLYRYGLLFFNEIEQGIAELNEFNGKMNGSLKVGCLPLARSSIVPQAILALNSEFPDANLALIDGPYQEQLHSLLHGEIDIIVGALRTGSQNTDISQVPLFNDKLSIVVKAKHPLANKTIFSATELQQLQWVAPNKSTPAWHVFSQLFNERNLNPPSNVIECSSLVAIRSILMHSERAALLPAKQVEVEVAAGLLAVCPITLADTDRSIGLTLRKNWQPTQMQAQFLHIIKQQTAIYT